MVKKESLLLLLLITALIIMMKLPSGRFAPLPRVYVDPPIGQANPGESFFVDIMVADVERLYSWQVNISFSPSVLQFVNVTEGDFLKGQPEGTWTVAPSVDNTAGWAVFSWYIQGAYLGLSGDGWLATVEFSVAEGDSFLNIDDKLTKLIEWIPPPTPPGKEVMELIPHTRENGFFINTVVPPHAEFSYSPSVPGVGEEITFNASASYATSPNNITQLEWDFGDNATEIYVKDINLTYTTTHTYTAADTYEVSLTVFDDAPATDLVKSIFGTTGMPPIWYDLYSKYETSVVIGLPHDVAVTDVKVSKSQVTAGEIVNINVTVLNKGVAAESFNVTAYYGDNAIEKKPVLNLDSGANLTLQFSWDTSNVPSGVYTIKAIATDVAGEGNAADNTKIDGTVEILSSGPGSLFPLAYVAAAVVIVIVIVAGIFFLRRKGA